MTIKKNYVSNYFYIRSLIVLTFSIAAYLVWFSGSEITLLYSASAYPDQKTIYSVDSHLSLQWLSKS